MFVSRVTVPIFDNKFVINFLIRWSSRKAVIMRPELRVKPNIVGFFNFKIDLQYQIPTY